MGYNMKLPPGCSIEWMREPARQTRLLDWLDSNPSERACLFLESNEPSLLSRRKCAVQAAQYVFRNDENPKNSAAVMTQPVPFSDAIIKLITRGPSSWKTKYEKVNKTLGPVASKLPYAEFQVGSHIQKKAVEELRKFPQWKRLHVHWRTSPHFNPFVNKRPHSSSGSQIKAAMKRKVIHEESEEDRTSDLDIESEDEEESEPKAPTQKKPRLSIRPPSDGDSSSAAVVLKRARRLSNASVTKTVKFATEEGSNNDVFEETKEELSSSELTGDQRFQLQMAELRYKTQREENIARQQEQTQRVLLALLDAVKH